MSENTETDNAKNWNVALHFLDKSLWSVLFVFACFVLLAVVSALCFLYQVNAPYEYNFREKFRDQPGAWCHLLGHLLRCAIGTTLACCLWYYRIAVRRLRQPNPPDPGQFCQTLARWWHALAISLLVILVYAIIAPIFERPFVAHRDRPSSHPPAPKYAVRPTIAGRGSPLEGNVCRPLMVVSKTGSFDRSSLRMAV